jgi:hypothetical protein
MSPDGAVPDPEASEVLVTCLTESGLVSPQDAEVTPEERERYSAQTTSFLDCMSSHGFELGEPVSGGTPDAPILIPPRITRPSDPNAASEFASSVEECSARAELGVQID